MKRCFLTIFCVIMCFAALFAACAPKDEVDPEASPTPTSDAVPLPMPEQTPDETDAGFDIAKVYYDGTYEVGLDMPAATYFAMTDWGLDAKVIVKDSSGNVLLEDVFKRYSIIVIDENESVEIINCGLIDVSQTQDYVRGVFTYGIPDGAYIVGFHISAGIYGFRPYEGYTGARYEIYSDATRANLIASGDIADGEETLVTLEEGQVIFTFYTHMLSWN